MTNKNDLFNLHQPKIHIQTVELGPHRQRIFTLPKFEKEKKYTPLVWVVATFLVGFSLVANMFESAASAYKFTKNTLLKEDTIAFTPATSTEAPDKLLGSDDVVEPSNFKEVVKTGEYYSLNKNVTAPRTSALSYIVADADTGQVILEKSPTMVLPMASVSKLMTAVIAKEFIDPYKEITVTRSSVETYGTAGGLVIGEKILATDLYTPLLTESSNDAAEVFTSSFGRADFLRKMNDKAQEFGMVDTYYDDPSGLSARNVSTAEDLLILARYILKEKPELWDITRIREFMILNHKWQNGNNQLRKSSFIGGKNGFTDEALKTTVSLFTVSIKIKDQTEKQKKRIAVIVLKSNDRDGDVDKLLRYVENNIGFEEKMSLPETSSEEHG